MRSFVCPYRQRRAKVPFRSLKCFRTSSWAMDDVNHGALLNVVQHEKIEIEMKGGRDEYAIEVLYCEQF